MKTIYLIIMLVCGLNLVNAQKLKATEVPPVVSDAFNRLYPNAKVLKWEKENSNYEVEIKENKQELSVVFDSQGRLIETEKEIKISELPRAVIEYVANNFGDKKIKEASKITDAANIISYEAEVDDTDYIFDEAGTLLKKETDNEKNDDK